MHGAIILALISLQTDEAITAAGPPDWASPPIESDIQRVLRNTTQMYSTNGPYNLYDFAVRNLSCGAPKSVSQPPKPVIKNGDSKVIATIFDKPDTWHYEMRCSFEYTALRVKAGSPRIQRSERQTPSNFNVQEISSIPPSSWWREEADIVYISNTKCRYMGRTPKYGECHYWVPLSTISAATLKPQIPGAGDVQLALLDRWIMQSSSGMYIEDYVVRGLNCGLPQSLVGKPESQKLKYGSLPDKPLHKVRCSFEYSGVEKQAKERGGDIIIKPRRFSKFELNAIPVSSWSKDEQDIFYMPPSYGYKVAYWLMPGMQE